jgi:hypothetical protein
MFLNQFMQETQLRAAEPPRLGKRYRLQPVLRIVIALPHVDVAGLISLPAEEEKAISAKPIHLWHSLIL